MRRKCCREGDPTKPSAMKCRLAGGEFVPRYWKQCECGKSGLGVHCRYCVRPIEEHDE